ncbi:hypothetical protein GI374_07505 [Paracoccus sp. S-4012]|uniref:hypothetical protein n=1 Tax=Paracoccus sp. S-4012 TaxID=2665648 RepID=UPI0012B0C029|nr:hypothetical protein [Paracoccus sp. S-4012]MRX50295.1 hypothetical protein [Paracoccus sp. S-4012]
MTRLEGGAGPEWLDQHPIEQAVRATEMLGLLIAFGPVAMPSEQGVSDWDCAGRIGFNYTSAGESGIREALRQAQAAYRGKGLPKRFNVFGSFYRWLASPKTRKEVGDIKRIMREHILETMEVAPNEIILGGSIPQRRLHSVKSLALEAKLQPRTLRRLLAARGVIPSDEKIDEYHVFDAEVGRAVAASAHRLIDVQALPKTLNCTRPQAGQLLDEQLLVRVGGAPSDAPGRKQRAVDGRQVEAFLATFGKDARRVDTPPEGFLTISKAAEKAGVPCYAIVHLILGGFLDGVARLAQVEGYSGILVDPNEVRAQAHRFQQGLSPGEAFGKLKVPKDTGWALVHREGEVALKPLVTIGPSGHRFYRFDEAEVSGFARRFTTEIRIANGLEVQCNEVVSRLKKDRIRPVLARREIGLDLYRTADLPASYFP